MNAYICMAALLTLTSSLSLAEPDTRAASTSASAVTSKSAPAMNASPGVDEKALKNAKAKAEVQGVLAKMIFADGMLNSLWCPCLHPQRPAVIAEP
jgi:hypothetical protein